MLAAVLEDKHIISQRQVPDPVCGVGEVLVRVSVCGICRTDMKAYTIGQRDLRLPRILGHEMTGTVAVVGKGVQAYQIGDRVQVAPGIPCGQCDFCREDEDQLCDEMQIMGFHYDGGFAEYVLVPARGVARGILNKIPSGLSFREAALTEPLACCVNMQNKMGIGPGETLVIYGGGPLGILNAKLARKRGAARIILVEKKESRLIAAQNDFDDLIHGDKEDACTLIRKYTDGKGASAVISCCPDPAAFYDGLKVLKKKGRMGFFSGLVQMEDTPPPDWNLIHYKELVVYGAYGCSSSNNREALDLLASGGVTVSDMSTKVLPLAELEKGLNMVVHRDDTNLMIDMSL